MARDRNATLAEKEGVGEDRKSKRKARENTDTDSESEDRKRNSKQPLESEASSSDYEEEDRRSGKSNKVKRKARKRRSRSHDSDSGSGYSDSEGSEYSESESEVESEEERRRRKRRERKKRREKEEERERKRRKREKEKKKRRKEKEEKRKKRKKEKIERGKRGAVTNSWGKYGIIRETDMWTEVDQASRELKSSCGDVILAVNNADLAKLPWNKRPEFTAWLAEVKQVNLESLPNWEEKQMFKEFMEDHNTATFSSKKYYNLDAYYKRQMEKEQKKGFKKVLETERTVFNDEEQRRQELMQAREKQKEEQVEALKRSMQGGMAQAMKEQAQLREEMAYQYKVGNFEAAAAIQRRLDPDIAM